MSTEFKSILSLDKQNSVFEQARDLQAQAATVGFDWPSIEPVLDKVEEELHELRDAIRTGHGIEEEYADLLFVLVNVARHLKFSPEEALKLANQKFIHRFNYIEQNCSPRKLAELSLDDMEALWQDAKTAFNS